RHPAGIDDEVEIVAGDRDRGQEYRVHLDAIRAVGPLLRTLDVFHGGAFGELVGDFGRAAPEVTSILPDRNSLGSECDAVERRVVAILPRDRNRTGQALRLESGNGATGGAVIGGDDGIHVIVVLGQELLHVAL